MAGQETEPKVPMADAAGQIVLRLQRPVCDGRTRYLLVLRLNLHLLMNGQPKSGAPKSVTHAEVL